MVVSPLFQHWLITLALLSLTTLRGTLRYGTSLSNLTRRIFKGEVVDLDRYKRKVFDELYRQKNSASARTSNRKKERDSASDEFIIKRSVHISRSNARSPVILLDISNAPEIHTLIICETEAISCRRSRTLNGTQLTRLISQRAN